jgi:uncharacterized repeat protein (TIGR01451 family)
MPLILGHFTGAGMRTDFHWVILSVAIAVFFAPNALAAGSGVMWSSYVNVDAVPTNMPILLVDHEGPVTIKVKANMSWDYPEWRQARLDLLDMNGTVVFTHHYEIMEQPGWRVGTYTATATLAPGMYYVRATKEGPSAYYQFETSAVGFVWPSGVNFTGYIHGGLNPLGSYWFFVPEGTTTFTFRKRGGGLASIFAPDGSMRAKLTFADSAQAVTVDNASAGAFWRVDLNVEYYDVQPYLHGIPPFFAESPAAWFDGGSPPTGFGAGSGPLWFREVSEAAGPVTMPMLRVDQAGPLPITVLTRALDGPGWLTLSLLDETGSAVFTQHFDFSAGFHRSAVTPSVTAGRYYLKIVRSSDTFYRFQTGAARFVWPAGVDFKALRTASMDLLGSYFFFVPAGTTSFVCALRVPDESVHGWATVVGPEGSIRATLSVKGGTTQSTTINVDPASAGKFWRVDLRMPEFGDVQFFLSGIPPFLAESPNAWFAGEAMEADLEITNDMQYDPPIATYIVTVTNHGPGTATGVRVTDTISPDATLVSVAASIGSCSAGPPIVCEIPALANGESATITVRVNVSNPHSAFNYATVTANEPDPNILNNNAPSNAYGNAPTLSQWMLAALALMLVGLGVVKLR